MSKVQITDEGFGKKYITVNGVDLSESAQKVEVFHANGRPPTVVIHCIARDGLEELLKEANVTAIIHHPEVISDRG